MRVHKPAHRLTMIIFVALLIGTAGCSRQDRQSPPEGSSSQATPAPQEMVMMKQYDSAPPMKIDQKKRYSALVKTSKGEFRIELLPAESPKTVNNFVFLARDGFYNGIKFHRIIRDFMVQTGDPLGDGTGGPGYTIEDELPPKHPYEAGTVAMARTRAPNSAGSQFFICTGKDCGGLNAYPDYTIFGRVSEGMDMVQGIAATPVGPGAFGEMSEPKEDVRILSVTIEER